MACITHADGVFGSTLFTPVSSAIANIGTSTSLGWSMGFVVLLNANQLIDMGGMYNSTEVNFYGIVGVDSSGHPGIDDSTANTLATAPLDATNWWYVAVTYPGGASNTQPVTFHYKNLTTAGNWTHTNAGNYHVVGSGTTSNHWVIGSQDQTSSDWGSKGITIGLCAAWGTVAMSNAQVETLSPNAASTSKTSDAWNNAVGHPDLLVECTSTNYKTDIGNNPSTYSSDANWTLTGANPTGWTFDGQGASSDLNVYLIN